MLFSQALAAAIFLVMFIAIIVGKWHRYIPALVGAALTIVLVFLVTMKSPEIVKTVLNLEPLGQVNFWIPGHERIEATQGINWQTIIFIGGMMTMVEGLNEVGFFRWLCLFVAKLVHYKYLDRDIESMKVKAKEYLDGVGLRFAGTKAKVRLEVGEGDGAREIIKVASAADTSLVAMSSHGHSSIEAWFHGSVTYKILQASQQSVMLVPARGIK